MTGGVNGGARPLPRVAWRVGEAARAGKRMVAEEVAVAIVHDGSTTAVMMATPADIEDLAIGFSLSEGIIDAVGDIAAVEVAEGEAGIEARLWLARAPGARLAARRRRLAGATGCGLCGIESLEEAVRPLRPVAPAGGAVAAEEIWAAMAALEAGQTLGRATRAVHAAALWRAGAIVAVREDVGRHNALDKLIGAAARGGAATDGGLLLLTSRVSVEMVQKAAALGAPVVCAVSAPTTLAVRTAQAAGLTLACVVRADGLEVFCGALAEGPAPPAG